MRTLAGCFARIRFNFPPGKIGLRARADIERTANLSISVQFDSLSISLRGDVRALWKGWEPPPPHLPMGPFAFTLIYSGRLLHDTSPLITYAYTFLRRSLYISIRTNNIPFLSISLLISPFGRSVAKTHQHTHTRLDLSVRHANVAARAYVYECSHARTNNIRLPLLCAQKNHYYSCRCKREAGSRDTMPPSHPLAPLSPSD